MTPPGTTPDDLCADAGTPSPRSPLADAAHKTWLRHRVYGGYDADTKAHRWIVEGGSYIRELADFLHALTDSIPESVTRPGWETVRDGIAINDDADRTMRHAFRDMIDALGAEPAQ